jgi:hypothetical protein
MVPVVVKVPVELVVVVVPVVAVPVPVIGIPIPVPAIAVIAVRATIAPMVEIAARPAIPIGLDDIAGGRGVS